MKVYHLQSRKLSTKIINQSGKHNSKSKNKADQTVEKEQTNKSKEFLVKMTNKLLKLESATTTVRNDNKKSGLTTNRSIN